MNPHTATLNELRDWLAVNEGWRIFEKGLPTSLYLAPGKHKDADRQVDHPIPYTLDAAVAAIGEIWDIEQVRVSMCASDGLVDGLPGFYWFCDAAASRNDREFDTSKFVRVKGPFRGSRHEAMIDLLFRLAVACRLAEKEPKP